MVVADELPLTDTELLTACKLPRSIVVADANGNTSHWLNGAIKAAIADYKKKQAEAKGESTVEQPSQPIA